MNKIIATFKVQNKHVKNTNELKNWELPLTTNLLLQNTNNLCNTPRLFWGVDKNKKIFIPRANKASF